MKTTDKQKQMHDINKNILQTITEFYGVRSEDITILIHRVDIDNFSENAKLNRLDERNYLVENLNNNITIFSNDL